MAVMVNGKAFDWGDITITLVPLTAVVYSAKEISFEESLEAEAIYGRGRNPVGYGVGNWAASGKLSMLKSEFEAMALISPSGILNMDPRYTIINVFYGNLVESTHPVTSCTLTGIRFTKISDSASQGDKELKVDLEFTIFGDILRNGKSARGNQLL